MAKDPALGIRLESDERAALERAAKADERPLSAMGRKILVEWLRGNGWMVERRAVRRDVTPRPPGADRNPDDDPQ